MTKQSKQTIKVDGQEITIQTIHKDDYISLTDMVRNEARPADVITNWLRTLQTLDFLSEWEQIYNPDFKVVEYHNFSSQAGRVRFTLSVSEWIEKTNAIGLVSKRGRYGGTYAHRDIAFEFGTRISARFKILLIKEFQILKAQEANHEELEWDYTRFLSKINYGLQTKAIEENILPRLEKRDQSFVYATEADLINLAVFGLTAKQWREQYPEQAKMGNIRDFASIQHLTVLANLQSLNSELIRRGAEKEARFYYLCEAAQFQLRTLTHDNRLQKPGDSLSLND